MSSVASAKSQGTSPFVFRKEDWSAIKNAFKDVSGFVTYVPHDGMREMIGKPVTIVKECGWTGEKTVVGIKPPPHYKNKKGWQGGCWYIPKSLLEAVVESVDEPVAPMPPPLDLGTGASFGNEQLDSASQGNEQLDRPSRGAVTATVEGKDCHAFGYQDGTVQLHEKRTRVVLSRFPPDETGENGHMGPILQICFLKGDKGDTIRSICSSRLIERNVSTGNVKRSEVAQRRRTPEEKKRAAPSDTAPSGAGTPPKKSKMADSRAKETKAGKQPLMAALKVKSVRKCIVAPPGKQPLRAALKVKSVRKSIVAPPGKQPLMAARKNMQNNILTSRKDLEQWLQDPARSHQRHKVQFRTDRLYALLQYSRCVRSGFSGYEADNGKDVIIQQIEVPAAFQRQKVGTIFVTMLSEVCKDHGRGVQIQNLNSDKGGLWAQSLLANNDWYPNSPLLGHRDFHVFSPRIFAPPAAPPAVPAKSRRQQEREHRNQARVDYFLHTEATDEVKHYRNVMCKKETQMDWLRWRLLQYIHSNRTKVIDDVLNAWAKVYNYNEMGIPNHIEKLSRDKLETLKANLEDDYFLAVVKNGYDEDYYEEKKKSNGLPELCSTKYDNKMDEAREKDNKWFKALKFLEPRPSSLYTKYPFDVFRDALLMAKDPPEGYIEAWESSNPTRRQFSSDFFRFEQAIKTLTKYEKDFEKCDPSRPLCKPRAEYFASLDWHNAPENTAFRALVALYKFCPYQSDVLKAKVLKHITAVDLKTVGKDDVEEYLLSQVETVALMGDNTLPNTWMAMISLKKKIKKIYPELWPSNPKGLNEKGVPDWDMLE